MDLDKSNWTPNKKLHSREHLLAEDLSKTLGETNRFAAYLGISKRFHESDLRAILRYVIEKENLPHEARGKYFFAAVRGLVKKHATKIKRVKQKRRKKLSKKSYRDGFKTISSRNARFSSETRNASKKI